MDPASFPQWLEHLGEVVVQAKDDFVEASTTFIQHVDWSEPWIKLLGVFHLTVLLICLITRKHLTFQFSFFLALLGFSEYWNEFARSNYIRFASKNYFDRNGAFIGIMFAFPVLVNAFIILVVDTMIRVKRIQLQKKRAEERKKAQ